MHDTSRIRLDTPLIPDRLPHRYGTLIKRQEGHYSAHKKTSHEYPAPGLSRTPDCEQAAPLGEALPAAGPSTSAAAARAPGALPAGCPLSHGARALLIRLLEPEPRARLRSLLALQQQHFFKDFSFVDARSKKFHPTQILEKYFPDGPVTSSDFVSDDTSFRDFSPDSK